MDTTDLGRQGPKQNASSWSWQNKEGEITRVSVPPHSCVYRNRKADDGDDTGDGTGSDEEALARSNGRAE